jgi:hypothetical protein
LTGDIVETLIEAASAAIRNQTPALTSDAGYVKSVTLELSLANGHQVIDSTCWVERRGVHRKKSGAMPCAG